MNGLTRLKTKTNFANPQVLHDVRRALHGEVKGMCYVASEAIYHLLGGKKAGLTPMVVHHQGETHWFLRYRDGAIIDATVDQYNEPVNYELGKGCGFLTKEPSKRAQELISNVLNMRGE